MIENFRTWLESLTKEKLLLCLLVLVIAAVSLGFYISKGAEYSLNEGQILTPSDDYKLDVVQSEVNRK